MIDSMRKNFNIKELCEAFKVSPSSYYAWKQAKPTKRLLEEKKIIEAIKTIHSHRHMKSYGSPRMTEERKEPRLSMRTSPGGTADARTRHIRSSSKSLSTPHR